MNFTKLTKQDVQKAYDAIKDNDRINENGITWHKVLYTFDDGTKLCFTAAQMDYNDEDNYEPYCKLGCLAGNSAMSEYDMDFIMPYDEDSGEVWDTETTMPLSDRDIDWYNEQAEGIINAVENGELLVNSRKIESMARSYLKPEYDSRASFYNKAEVDDDKLYSYGTLVAEIIDGKPVLHDKWDYSQTTLRHVREWLAQNGFATGTKQQMAQWYEIVNSRKPVKSGRYIKSAENEGWVVEHWESEDAYNLACEYMGTEYVNQAIVDSLSDDEMAESLAWLFRQWDFREWDDYREGDSDDEDEDEEIESACHGKSKKDKKKKPVKSGMSVRELPREALEELKLTYYQNKEDRDISYGEMAQINDLVSDEEIFEEYGDTDFTKDDFFSMVGSARKPVKSGKELDKKQKNEVIRKAMKNQGYSSEEADAMVNQSRKIQSGYSQKQLKEMADDGVATDITNWSEEQVREIKPLTKVATSKGSYGMNGALLKDNDGNLYVITARNSLLFYCC